MKRASIFQVKPASLLSIFIATVYDILRFTAKIEMGGWLGRAMVLGSFQCRSVLLLWHMVGQEPAVLAAGAGRVGCF